MSLTGKIALVTGASRGIGRAIALELLHQGATVIGASSNENNVNDFSVLIKEMGLKGKGMIMDVGNPEAIAQTLEKINADYGPISILVNNAGITRDNLLLRMSQSEWDQVIATNLTSLFTLCKLCIRDMIKARYGRIVNITSIVAYSGNAGQANYAAAKAGMVAFSKSLALEVASRNVTVNCIAPGYIETDMTNKLTEVQRTKLLETIPMKRAGQAEDIARATAFLVSDAASYITGNTLHINGGMMMI